jgi:polyhydroxyalkanoate synthesis repressor PhaR
MALLIKRYPNRKLYNTHTKEYISLEQLTDLVRQGVEIRVVDQLHGEDQTAITLSQILLQQEKRQSGFLPIPLLTILVQTGGDALEAIRRLIARSFDLDRHTEAEIKRRINRLVADGDLSSEEGERLVNRMQSEKLREDGAPSLIDRWLELYLTERGFATRADYAQLVADIQRLADEVERLRQNHQA